MIPDVDFLTMFDVSANDRTALLKQIAAQLLELGYVYPSFEQALLEREEKYPTGLPSVPEGVAMPHVDAEHVKKSAIVTVLLREPVEFMLMGGPVGQAVSCRCLFVLLINECNEHLKTLSRFIRVIQHPEDMQAIFRANDPAKVEHILLRHMNR